MATFPQAPSGEVTTSVSPDKAFSCLELERTLGGGNAALFPWVQCHGLTQGPCQALEATLGNMVAVLAIERFHVQGQARIDGKRLIELTHQIGVENTDLLRGEGGPEHQEGAARYVERDARQGLIHRTMDVGIARDALFIAKRLQDGLTQRNPGILGRMMLVHMQVAGYLHGQVEETVSGKQFEHMVEEADPGGDLG